MKSVVSVTSMKRKVVGIGWRGLALGVVLGGLVVVQSGCSSWSQPGMTGAEANRNRKRVLRVNSQELMADIDTVLLLDRPSHLTDRRLP